MSPDNWPGPSKELVSYRTEEGRGAVLRRGGWEVRLGGQRRITVKMQCINFEF